MAPKSVSAKWIWWDLPIPGQRKISLTDIPEHHPTDVNFHPPEKTKTLLEMMSGINTAKVTRAQGSGVMKAGCSYRRMRNGIQRAEVRFDNVSGCLRTPSGGSSRQTLPLAHGKEVRSRLFSAREVARLIGLSEKYKLPKSYHAAYHLAGDGVAVPAVKFLA